MLHFFSHREVSPRLYIVTENLAMSYRLSIPVVIGTERILVVDSGLGVCGDLRKYIETFAGVTKPIFCICTHGHQEQLGGAGLFDEAYLSAEDIAELSARSLQSDVRLSTFENVCNHCDTSVAFCREMMEDVSATRLMPTADGDVFHLGEARIEVFALPGHTKGSVVVRYSHKDMDKYLFTSGALDRMTCLKSLDRPGMARFVAALDRIIELVGDDIHIVTSRTDVCEEITLARSIATACREILDGKTKNDPPADVGAAGCKLHYLNNVCVRYSAAMETLQKGASCDGV